MRNNRHLAPNRYKTAKTSGSNKFVLSFSQREISKGIVEKRDRKYNWIGYIWSLGFTAVIGCLTYLVIDYLMF